MTDSQEQILAAARNYVTDLITHQVKPEFVFHNIEHTEGVAEACSQMADYYHLNNDDRYVLMLAAWFHDTGYSSGHAEGHEDVSIQIAIKFLQDHNVDEATVQRVSSCIQATRMPQSPISQVEKILCDADLSHLASEDYKATTQLLKQERENLLGHKIPKKEWRKDNIRFLSDHKYFTEYGLEFLEPKKIDNVLELRRKAHEPIALETESEVFPYQYSSITKREQKAFEKNTERSIQTMFRMTSSNHLRLSSMADNKSHIMISVNSIIVSIVLSVLFGKFSGHGAASEDIIPASILILVCVSSMTFAILATRPSISGGRFTEEDIRNKKTNLLFFGNFFRMQLEDYQHAMNQMMKDGEYLHNSMIKDIYYLGIVLAKKYRYLRISYTIFMYGLILAVIAFVIAAFISTGNIANSQIPVIDYK